MSCAHEFITSINWFRWQKQTSLNIGALHWYCICCKRCLPTNNVLHRTNLQPVINIQQRKRNFEISTHP